MLNYDRWFLFFVILNAGIKRCQFEVDLSVCCAKDQQPFRQGRICCEMMVDGLSYSIVYRTGLIGVIVVLYLYHPIYLGLWCLIFNGIPMNQQERWDVQNFRFISNLYILEISRISMSFSKLFWLSFPLNHPAAQENATYDGRHIVPSQLSGIRRDRYLSLGCQGRSKKCHFLVLTVSYSILK